MTAHMIGVTGIPGSGKSYFARSAAELGTVAVALTDPKEAAFYAGIASGNHLLAVDLEWRPHLNKYNATAYNQLLRWVGERETDDSKFIIIDPMSEVSDLAFHEMLKMHATADPSDLSHGRAYTGHDTLLKQLIGELRRLVVQGKTVICTFHGQMRELEGAGDAKKEKSMSGKAEWTFDEQMLPVIGSSFRQRIGSPFDLWLYTKPEGFGPGRQFFVTAIPDAVRPAKHSVTFKDGANPARLPNTLRGVLEAIEEVEGR